MKEKKSIKWYIIKAEEGNMKANTILATATIAVKMSYKIILRQLNYT